MRVRALLLVAALTGCGSQPAPAPTASPGSDSARAYAQAAHRMHEGMAVTDPDPDVAFARGMIPHHQGAIEMARVELRYGRDPEMRALAEAVIAAQGPEIAALEHWLARRGKVASEPAHRH